MVAYITARTYTGQGGQTQYQCAGAFESLMGAVTLAHTLNDRLDPSERDHGVTYRHLPVAAWRKLARQGVAK